MGVWGRFQQFRQDAAVSNAEVKKRQAAAAREREREREARRAAGGCTSNHCPREAVRNGYCGPCWTAIFG